MLPVKSIHNSLLERKASGRKTFALLVDPDKTDSHSLKEVIEIASISGVDYFFVGGSLVVSDFLKGCVQQIKNNCQIPIVLFPGSPAQLCSDADALLYLSLISGRNPELLIGQHVVSANAVKKSGLEVMSTGYMLIDGGAPTSVSYISNTAPLPSDKMDIAVCTAMAGEMLGMKLIYMDAGSGAKKAIDESMISAVSQSISIPLIVGGGISDPEKAYLNCKAGADIIVVGNAIEKEKNLIAEMSAAVHQAKGIA